MIPTETSIVHTETTVLINMHLTSFAPIWYSPIPPFLALLFHIFTAADASHLQESQPREITDPTHFAKAKWAIESGRESYSHLSSNRITMPLRYAHSHMPNLIPWSGIIQPCLNYQPYQREHSTRMSLFSMNNVYPPNGRYCIQKPFSTVLSLMSMRRHTSTQPRWPLTCLISCLKFDAAIHEAHWKPNESYFSYIHATKCLRDNIQLSRLRPLHGSPPTSIEARLLG